MGSHERQRVRKVSVMFDVSSLPSMHRCGRLHVAASLKDVIKMVAEMVECNEATAVEIVRIWTERGYDYTEELIRMAIETDTTED